MAAQMDKDLPLFQEKGLDQMDVSEKEGLRAFYTHCLDSRENESSKAASEIIDWLDGKTIVTKELFETQ